MKWVLANQSSAAIKKYQLTEQESIKLDVKYNSSQQTVRISSEDTHRLFFLDKTGLWHNKTILKNEYGVEIGRLYFDKLNQRGTIEVEGKRYDYAIQQTTLVVYERHISRPLASCELSANQYSEEEMASLLLGLCWYLFPLTTAEKLEYAVA